MQTKTPLLTIDTIRDAKARGHTVWTEHTLESMDLSNGCTGLGVAVALGEIEMPTDEAVLHDRSLYPAVASCSSGVELDRAQVVVVGNVRGIGGRYRIGHSVMRDALDADGIWAAIQDAGLDLPSRPHRTDLDGRLVNVFLKCEVSQDGSVRGRRNAMLDDSDVHWHRQIEERRRRGSRLGHRRPRGVRVRVGRPPGPGRRRAGGGDRRPRPRASDRLHLGRWRLNRGCRGSTRRHRHRRAGRDGRAVRLRRRNWRQGGCHGRPHRGAPAGPRRGRAQAGRVRRDPHRQDVAPGDGHDNRAGRAARPACLHLSRLDASLEPEGASGSAPTQVAAAAALADGADAVVVDLAGPVVFAIEAGDLQTLGSGPCPPERPRQCARARPEVVSFRLTNSSCPV